jgi:hypothetical protein
MIDQSNRAGKLTVNVGEDLNGQNLSYVPTSICIPPIIVTKRRNHPKRIRESLKNQRRLHHRTNSTKTSVSAAVASRRSPLSYMTKGKSI